MGKAALALFGPKRLWGRLISHELERARARRGARAAASPDHALFPPKKMDGGLFSSSLGIFAQVDALNSIDDPEETPYVSKYKARDLLVRAAGVHDQLGISPSTFCIIFLFLL